MIALAYLATVVVALVVLAVALRHRPDPAPAPVPPAPAASNRLLLDGEPEVRLILAAATQLAYRMGAAA
ncbi:hypothetical protein [Streptomyces sp. NPDC006997]|uniref:hypothetical protein n=1 Tax=Streptomyces sp. NPDC006997 TaxID=3155356 RepID=UPI0033CB8EAF